jgi:N-acetylneuraminic acid mutarotase
MNIILLLLLLSISCNSVSRTSIEEVATLPEAVANNAVCEGFMDGTPYLYSFGGVDSTKIYSGIHVRSFRANLKSLKSERIPDLPDTLGKIAAGASRIGNIIYIIGGYYVFADGSELSSKKIHRYDIKDNIFLSDGANIPVPIDDHVQVVWQDKLIYVIAGWSNTGNVPNVQIYDPGTDSWSVGTPLPNTGTYKSFGASGTIIGNIIYYFGGAGSSYSPQNTLRKGIIDTNDPTHISWTASIPDSNIFGYRMASTTVQNRPLWIGGSQNTYNFNGIAYDKSGGVSTSNRILHNTSPHIESEFNQIFLEQISMDLRGIANLGDGKLYIAGGMIDNQKVTDKIYEIIINTF